MRASTKSGIKRGRNAANVGKMQPKPVPGRRRPAWHLAGHAAK